MAVAVTVTIAVSAQLPYDAQAPNIGFAISVNFSPAGYNDRAHASWSDATLPQQNVHGDVEKQPYSPVIDPSLYL